MAGYCERDVVLRHCPKIEAPSKASSFVLFSPRPHRQLAASSVISFELGDGYCPVAEPGVISGDRRGEETLERHPGWGVSQWMREKTALVCRGGKHRNPEERKGEIQNGSLFRISFLVFPLSRSPLILPLQCEKRGREEEREREGEKERERKLFCPLAMSSFFSVSLSLLVLALCTCLLCWGAYGLGRPTNFLRGQQACGGVMRARCCSAPLPKN